MNKRRLEILKGLWRWKLLSTAVIAEVYFPNQEASYAYRDLVRLRDQGLVCVVHVVDGTITSSYVWTLTKRGYNKVKDVLPKLMSDGFRSECARHDYLVSIIHLGNWIFGVPEGCDLFSEQELRRYYPEHFPNWIPSNSFRRPDGYWRTRLNGQPGTIALEVELKGKSEQDYSEIAQSYALMNGLFRIVWVVESAAIAKLILRSIDEVSGKAKGLHSFLLLSDVKCKGWEATFFSGRDSGKNLSQLLPSEVAISLQYIAPKLQFNLQKSPHITKAYRELKKTLKLHRLGSSLFNPSTFSDVPQHQTKGELLND